jgi:hypothetical protein
VVMPIAAVAVDISTQHPYSVGANRVLDTVTAYRRPPAQS